MTAYDANRSYGMPTKTPAEAGLGLVDHAVCFVFENSFLAEITDTNEPEAHQHQGCRSRHRVIGARWSHHRSHAARETPATIESHFR